MKQITIDAIVAFRNGTKFKRDNTEVRVFDGFAQLRLFGNVIAELSQRGLFITSCGWQTVTTKERLNGLPNVHIVQKNSQWFLNGKPWNGSLIEV